jgi:hypothetical protein
MRAVPAATGPTPSTSATESAVPSPAPSAATAASAGTASPAPVVVVDDPPPDGVAVAGLVFSILAFVVGSLASGFSIYLAWRAMLIGKTAAREAVRANTEASRARAAVAAERRRTFEMEVLRDLTAALDAERPHVIEAATDPRRMRLYFGARLQMLPEADLPLWRQVQDMDGPEALMRLLGLAGNTDSRTGGGIGPDWVRASRNNDFQRHNEVSQALRDLLLDDLITAIRVRVEANDA